MYCLYLLWLAERIPITIMMCMQGVFGYTPE